MDIHGGYVVLDTPVSEKMKSKLPEESLEMNAYVKTALGLASTGTPGNPDLNPVDQSMITIRQTSFPKATISTATPERPRNASTPYVTPGGPAILTINNATKHNHFNLELITPHGKYNKIDVIQLQQQLDKTITQEQKITSLNARVSANSR